MKKPKLGTANSECIFLDVAGYSKRTIESQSSVIKALNRIVREAVSEHRLGSDRVIYIPTGDGICIALLNVSQPYDVQMQIALGILKCLKAHNVAETEEEVRFEVRIGINADKDNVIVDINGHCNLSGKGINEASRIMDKADGGQILVGNSVFEPLKSHRQYLSAFRPYTAIMKHGLALRVYQFVGKGHSYLNLEVPTAFRTPADAAAKTDLKSGEASTRLKSGGLKIHVEIGPSLAQLKWGEVVGAKLKEPLNIMALIDTGSSRTIINPQIALTCGLTQIGRAMISTTGQVTEVPEYVGAIRFPGSDLKSVDPIRLVACSLPGADFSCLIGRDILERWRFVYDGRTGQIEIKE